MVFIASVLSAAVTAASLAGLSAAHPLITPGSPEFEKRAIFQRNARRSLASCQSELSKRGGVYDKAKLRRESQARQIRKTRGLASEFFLFCKPHFIN